MGKDKIIIFYDNRRNFYIKKSSGEKDLLPESFIDFKRNHKKILAAAYPHMEKHIMSSEITDDEIDKMLHEYNFFAFVLGGLIYFSGFSIYRL